MLRLYCATLTVQWSQFSALSARAPAGTGEQTLILGFVFAGGGKPTLVRGVGPNMSDTVSGYMRDPQLTLYTAGGSEVARNDNWGGTSALSTAFAQTGAGPLIANSKDAALLETLMGNVYTAHVSGVNGTTGVALAEAFDAALSDNLTLAQSVARVEAARQLAGASDLAHLPQVNFHTYSEPTPDSSSV